MHIDVNSHAGSLLTGILQMDEPSLPAVVAGAVSTISGMGAYPPIEPDLALGADLVHCCAPGLPFARCVAAAGCCSICHCTTRLRTSSWRELSTDGTVLGFGVSPVPGSVRSVLDFFDRTGLYPAARC
jgi:hypothetical protein